MPVKKNTLSYGRKKRKSVSKGVLPGKVELRMCISPGIGKKLKWVKVPCVGSLRELGTVDVDEDLTKSFVRSWYLKLRKAKALKIAFIVFMQRCVALSYFDRLPTWFGKKIRYKTSDITVQDYYLKAKRILAAYLLYKHDGIDGNFETAGHLATRKCVRKINALTAYPKFKALEVYRQNRKIASLIKFKKIDSIKAEVKNYDNRIMSIWDIIRACRAKTGRIHSLSSIICQDEYKKFVETVELVMNHPEGYLDLALYGGITKHTAQLDLQQLENTIQSLTEQLKQARKVETETSISESGETITMQEGEGIPPPPSPSGGTTPDFRHTRYISDKTHARLQQAKEALSGFKFRPPKPKPPIPPQGGEPQYTRLDEDGDPDLITIDPRTKKSYYEGFLKELAAWKVAQRQKGAFGRNRHAMRYRRHPGMRKRPMGPRFGRSPNLTRMTGYVRPYRLSAMEQYTGMTPGMYRRHINSRTGNPMGMPSPRLARANSYYGSYPLGEKLNPSFGRRRRRATNKPKPRPRPRPKPKRKSRAKTKTKKRCAKKRCAKKNDLDFGKFFF